ncbi:MAG: PASTA domain-containing protein [Bacteroidia bacterium]|nr:PASTA domain-containing protein [Bacteroidia bacterium]
MFKYFISREFLMTLLGLTGLGILVYMLIFFWILPSYTRHGDGLLVPDVNTLSVEEAEKILEDAGLRPEIIDSIFQDQLPGRTVLKQYPAPYSRVKPNRTISLTINKSEPPMVTMPEIVDMSLYQAKARLEIWKLGVGKVTRIPDIAENVVLKVSYKGSPIQPGAAIPQGSKIDLVVGQGLGYSNVQIPDLIGYSYEDALNILSDMGLGLGSVDYNPTGPPDQMGRIYSQNPKPGFGDSVRMGFSIDIYVYGQEPEGQEGIFIEDFKGEGEGDENKEQ